MMGVIWWFKFLPIRKASDLSDALIYLALFTYYKISSRPSAAAGISIK